MSFSRSLLGVLQGSLDSYMQCLVTDTSAVEKHYLEYALLRNTYSSAKFVSLLISLAQIDILPLVSTVIHSETNGEQNLFLLEKSHCQGNLRSRLIIFKAIFIQGLKLPQFGNSRGGKIMTS